MFENKNKAILGKAKGRLKRVMIRIKGEWIEISAANCHPYHGTKDFYAKLDEWVIINGEDHKYV